MRKAILILLFIFIVTFLEAKTTKDVIRKKRFTDQDYIKDNKVLIGRNFLIPCDISSTSSDYPVLIFLYKDSSKFPIYSIDSRTSRSLLQAKRWETAPYRGRLKLELGPKRQGIVLENLRADDEGLFICRVDFISSPTRRTKNRVSVIKPVTKLVLFLEGKSQRILHSGVIGPFDLGTELLLTCKAVGGEPNPEVSWWHGPNILDSVSEFSVRGISSNTIHLPPLTLQDQYKELTCKAINSHFFPTLSSSVTIKVRGTRKWVQIASSVPYIEPARGPKIITVTEGDRLKLQCKFLEENPKSKINWTKKLKDQNETVENINVSLSILHNRIQNLTVIAEYKDNEAVITCQVTNLGYFNEETEEYEESIKLNVLYKPRVVLTYKNIPNDSIEEGTDVYMRCQSNSNPPPSAIEWIYNGAKMHFQTKNSILDPTNTSLVLLAVSPTSSGEYFCVVKNSKGTSASNVLQMNVMHKPRCIHEKLLIASNLKQSLKIICHIEAYPNVTTFRWAFKSTNSSSEFSNYNVLPHQTSYEYIEYQVTSPNDFSSLLCWASNTVGEMTLPCSISVVPTGKPEPVSYCEIIHLKHDNNTVMKCSEGFDGGLHQSFALRIWKMGNNGKQIYVNSYNSTSATFNISGLISGEKYLFNITAWNCEGESNPVLLTYRKPLTKVDSTDNDLANPKIIPMAAVILGVGISLLASIIFLLCCVTMRCCKKKMVGNTTEDDLYHERVMTPLVNEKKLPSELQDPIYISAGRLVIGVKDKKRRRGLDTIDIIDHNKKYNMTNSEINDPDQTETLMNATNKIDYCDSSFLTTDDIERSSTPYLQRQNSFTESVSTSSSQDLRFNSKFSISTVVHRPMLS